MTLLRLALALVLALASACAGTCSAMEPMGGGGMLMGMGDAMLVASPVVDAPDPAPTPPGDPSLWYSAANIDGQNNATLSDSDPVCTWVDLGSLGVDATQGDTGACPTFDADGGPGGGPALVFDGGDYLVTTGVETSQTMSQPNLIAVVSSAADLSAIRPVVSAPDGNFQNMVRYTATPQFEAFAGSSLVGGTPVAGQWDGIVALFSGASSSLRANGAEVATGDTGGESLRNIYIGANTGLVVFYVGSVGEVLVYDTPPDPTDVETYLAAHHGVTFPVAP